MIENIKISDYRIHETSTEKLSWIQNLVCRWFKITPLLKKNYKILINENCETGLHSSHIVVGADGNQLRALDQNTLVTLMPLANPPVIGNQISILYSAYFEG